MFQQRNLKQKFVALLKRFRVPEELQPGETRNSGALEGDREIDELFKVFRTSHTNIFNIQLQL